MLPSGLYEQVINIALNRELSEIPDARKSVAPIDKAEASKVLAQYLADVVQKGLENVVDNGGDISTQISLANQIVTLIQNTTGEADFALLSVEQRAEQILALLRGAGSTAGGGQNGGCFTQTRDLHCPEQPVYGAIHEPQMYTELKKEIVSADRIDMLVAFLSNAAISSGLEWNVKATRRDLPETIDKIAATFESYWNSNEFEYYSEDQKERLARALKAEKILRR